MRIPNTVHTGRPWRIHELTGGFRLEDVWALPGRGGHRAELAVYVKPNGRFGEAYMLAIKPFRHLLVYPPMLREFGRRWNAEGQSPRATNSTSKPSTSSR